MRHYCSLADSKYLPQLLALYESLKRHSSEKFVLHVLAMDDESADAWEFINPPVEWRFRSPRLVLAASTVDRLSKLERVDGFRKIRESRTWQETCWTWASSFTDMQIAKGYDSVTYLDADLMFFSDPKVIFDEIGDRSIAVIPHRWNEKDRKRLEPNGQFNVSWVTFKNNAIGRECLSTWARQCRERCSAKVGCGDQKYLDEWPSKYGSELCVIENIGAGVAPWNLQNYTVSPGPKVDGVPIVFYHYHEFMEIAANHFQFTNYNLREEDKAIIYLPYVQAYEVAKERIASVHLPA